MFYFSSLDIILNTLYCTKNEKNNFEENKFNERFGECLLFTSKEPLTMSLICIK